MMLVINHTPILCIVLVAFVSSSSSLQLNTNNYFSFELVYPVEPPLLLYFYHHRRHHYPNRSYYFCYTQYYTGTIHSHLRSLLLQQPMMILMILTTTTAVKTIVAWIRTVAFPSSGMSIHQSKIVVFFLPVNGIQVIIK